MQEMRWVPRSKSLTTVFPELGVKWKMFLVYVPRDLEFLEGQ